MKLTSSVFALPVPLLAASRQEFFGAEGLDVSYQPTTGSREQLAALLDGRIDVAHTAADNIIGLAERQPGRVRIVHVADLGLDQTVVAGRRIQGWDDVRGRRVAVDAPDSGYAFVLYRILRDQGIAPGQYERVTVGGPRLRFEALCHGDVDVGVLNPYYVRRAAESGLRALSHAGAWVRDYPNLTVATTARWARENPTEMRGYCRALSRAVAWAHDPSNRGRAVELLEQARGCDEREAEQLYEAERSLRTRACPTAREAVSGLEIVARLRSEIGGPKVSVDSFFRPVDIT
jgi:ABC-type nitrate/sulfonate/bicarbonate transport system substrate-binding protein